jgi:O-antigen ligase
MADAAVELQEVKPERRAVRGGELTLLAATALAALLIIAPLPLGGNRPWAASLLSALTVLLLLGNGVLLLAGQRRMPRTGLVAMLGVPWALALAWAFAQWLLPPPTASGPAAELWRLGAAALGSDVRTYWTVDRNLTAAAIQQQLCYGGVFLLALLAGLSDRGAERILMALALAGLGYALFALVNHADNLSTQILGFQQDMRVPSLHELRGTFIYRNAYAVCATLAVLCSIMLLLRAVDRHAGRWEGMSLVRFLAGGSGRNLWLALAAMVTLATIVASGSRGGSFAAAVALVLLALMGQRTVPRRYALLVAGAILLLALAAGIGVSILAERLLSFASGFQLRWAIWMQALEAVGREPWFGWGLGTFRRITPLLQPSDDPFSAFQTHSTILEVFADMGLVAGSLMLLPYFVLGFTFLAATLRRRRIAYAGLGLAVSVLALLQGAADFTLQMPAVAMWYAAICGVCLAQTEMRHLVHLPRRDAE